MRHTPIKNQVAGWADSDETDDTAPSVDTVVDRVFADCLAFLFVHCFTPERCSLKTAQRRFLALVYIYRPDLIEGRSVECIAKEINVTKGTIGRQLVAMRKEIGATGINSMEMDARRRVRAGQMRARLKKAKVKSKI